MEILISSHPVEYPEAILAMEQRVLDIQSGNAPELLWLLEHPHIYTAGTSANMSDILNHERCPIHKTGRGGQVTYHGTGQRIAYVMIDLKTREQDLRKYVYNLEQWIINSLSHIGMESTRKESRIGIWVDTPSGEKKIASIGVRVKKWVTMHGIAINIDPDLSYFNDIIPCGINQYGVTSAAELLNTPLPVDHIDQVLIDEFNGIF